MKYISVFLFLVIIINVIRAKNLLYIFLVNRNINRDLSKAPKPPLYIFAKTRTIGSFPRLPNTWSPKFIVDLNPPIETFSEAAQPEQYEKPLMWKLPIKYVSYKNNDKVNSEVATGISWMATKKFTVRPRDVYAESGGQNYIWHSNRTNLYKSSKPYKQYKQYKPQQYKPYSYVDPGSRKSKTLLVLTKKDNTQYFKENPEQGVFKKLQINNLLFENEVLPNVVNDSNTEEKKNITAPHNVLMKLESTEQNDQIIEATENRHELISFKEGKEFLLDVPDVGDNEEMATDNEIEHSVSRLERSVNIIEEERVATTFSGVTITNQEYPGHDLTFKNINT